MVNSIWSVAKAGCPTGALILFIIFFLIIKRRLESEKKNPTYNHCEIWSTTCYHSPLHGTIQFGVLQKLCARHGP